MSNHRDMIAAAVRAVHGASTACRFVQNQLESVRAITKDDRSPVTVADFASQAVVAHLLRESLGEIQLVAEEASAFLRDPAHAAHLEAAVVAARQQGAWPDATEKSLLEAIDVGCAMGAAEGRASSDGFWTLDPIDGTKGFLRGQQYAVCLAYIVGSEPVIGVLGCPNLPVSHERSLDVPDATGCLYVAERGGGAFEFAGVGDTVSHASAAGTNGRRIACGRWEPGMPLSLCESVDAGHSDHSATAAITAKVGPSRPPARLDSQCKYAVVARGQADLYLRLPTKKGYVERIWDHAAGACIAREAGCVVSDIRGNPLDFSYGRGLEKNSGIVVASPALHARVIAGAMSVSLP